jgi:hypothetical protein
VPTRRTSLNPVGQVSGYATNDTADSSSSSRSTGGCNPLIQYLPSTFGTEISDESVTAAGCSCFVIDNPTLLVP